MTDIIGKRRIKGWWVWKRVEQSGRYNSECNRYSRKKETGKRGIRMRRKRKSIKLFHIETCYFRSSFEKITRPHNL